MSELSKTFDPATIEARWAAHWEANGLFRPHRPDATPYTIVNPPPNVTGALHIGHALDNTLQDVLIRYERLRGKDALWVVGMDHAGIATQMVVERQLNERQDKRTNYSREDFIAKVWDWKAESGGQITGQLRRLGCSMDWSREQFTMSPEFTKAVTKVFVDLYNKGLIYRDKRLVNWDPGLKTAISDLEVETREINGKFWHFRYPLAPDADGNPVTLADGRDYIVVATTRPETMLADMAVAVNASDERYASVVGKHIILPITGRRIPMITDDHADPELGSGAVKITPGHDTNDFEVGRRAGIEARDMLNMFDGDARVVQTSDGLIPDAYLGQYRFGIEGEPTNARKLVVEAMEAAGLLERVEDRVIQTPFGDRSGVVIEPWLTDQWYVDAKTLAGPAMDAVRSGAVEIVPKSWEKTFFNWMENIQPWCVSRQLWWGHRIPVWYGPDRDRRFDAIVRDNPHDPKLEYPKDAIFAASSEDEAKILARQYYGEDQEIGIVDYDHRDSMPNVWLRRDEDVLDTWFSSALWPFATLGWPDEIPSPLAGEERDLATQELSRSGVGASAGAESHGAQTRADPAPQPSPARGEGASLLARHYPNDVLISGFDILFFWDARMLMQGIEFMGQAPWKKLYLHGLVRAPDGSKMAKSKGNVVNPLGLIDTYGADALRFFMAAMESQGRDIKMDDARLEGYRNFATKLWNATRFCQANGIGASTTLSAPPATLPVNRWIISEVAQTVTAMEAALAALRFDDAANAILHFTRDQFCDWYLELIKGQIDSDDGGETRAVAGWVLDQILVMLHPFMPFITEELWSAHGERPYNLIVAKWPDPRANVDALATAEINWLISLVSEIRSARSAVNIPSNARTDLVLSAESTADDAVAPAIIDRFIAHARAIHRLARVNIFACSGAEMQIELAESRLRSGTARLVGDGPNLPIAVDGHAYFIPLEGIIDTAAERARLTKAIEAATKDRDSLAARLSNPAFTERAKPEAVAKATEDHAARAGEVERLTAALARLG